MSGADITHRHPSRTPGTEAAYTRRLRQLTARARTTRHIAAADVTAQDISEDIDARAGELSAATLRQYRAALAYGIETGQLPDGDMRCNSGSAPRGQRRGRHTASMKLKRVTPQDLRRIDACLRRSSSAYARELRAFLLANLLVGARVTEWRNAQFVEVHPQTGAPALVLANAKRTNARAHGPDRTLHLGSLSPDALVTIATCARWLHARHKAGTFERWQAGAAKLLYRLCRKLWPRRRKHITLYSTRHHAAARYKSLYERAEVAAIMGHGALATAGTHYARTARGRARPRPGTIPTADIGDVRRVRRRYQARRPSSENDYEPPYPTRSGLP
jgi:hypothetical protein